CGVLFGAFVHTPPTSHAQSSGASLRFYGAGANDIDRVKIAIDNPARPADIGATDFTIEFWMKASISENSSPQCSGGGDSWITGNIMFDRDIFNAGDYGDYGISLAGGRIAFGVNNGSSSQTLCGATNVANGAWRHIAVTRSLAGAMRIFVDGALDAQANGPAGNVSYRDGRGTSYPNDPYLVIGAEKHDYDERSYPSYSGWIDEVRLSKALRYTSAFTRPTQPFAADAQTVALYHFDAGSGNTINDSSGAAGGPSTGVRRYGGSPAGPAWTTDTPFGSAPPVATPTRTPSPTNGPPATATRTPSPTSAPAATPTRTPSPTQPPAQGAFALAFDGADDQARGSQIAGTTGTQTIEAWIRPSTNNQNSIVLLTSDDNAGWSLELENGRVTWWVAPSSGQWVVARNSNVTLAAGTWYHVAVTYSGGTARVYVNGNAGSATAVGAITQGPWFRLGGLAAYSFFSGQIDEVRLSKSVRYSGAFTPPATRFATDGSTLALYHLDAGSGQTVADSSGNGYNLTLGTGSGSDSADAVWVTSTAPIN
ncbi:MAG TPA: LamG-like jellyroll fold domain-containing protein, partial [Roseiflexaceae bacterium]|nr:LamG-like jellyroll fold domain-containing protein [Roseiflexaceae bacterium]